MTLTSEQVRRLRRMLDAENPWNPFPTARQPLAGSDRLPLADFDRLDGAAPIAARLAADALARADAAERALLRGKVGPELVKQALLDAVEQRARADALAALAADLTEALQRQVEDPHQRECLLARARSPRRAPS